jgi:hypothetical protein
MERADAHPSGTGMTRPDPRPGIPTQLQASVRLWLLAIAAGLFETAMVVVEATSGRVGSAAEVALGLAVRLLAFTGAGVPGHPAGSGQELGPCRPGGAVWRARHPVAGDRAGELAGRGGIAQRRRGGGGPGVGAVRGQPGRAPGGGDRGGGADVPPGRQRLPPSRRKGSRTAQEAGTGEGALDAKVNPSQRCTPIFLVGRAWHPSSEEPGHPDEELGRSASGPCVAELGITQPTY